MLTNYKKRQCREELDALQEKEVECENNQGSKSN